MTDQRQRLGPVLIGLSGPGLARQEEGLLRHPAVGGVVLFTRNYRDPGQLAELTQAIRATARRPLLICVDHEGGRVQRFREGFTRLPPLGVLGRVYADHPERALDLAYRHARVMATELLLHGVDLSFAPVLDLDRGSEVIGDRAFATAPQAVAALGAHYLAGMHDAGMRTCGKHFPGHGSVTADSHVADAHDPRALADIEGADLQPFEALAGRLDAVMMAHVVYPACDRQPAGYSRYWIGGQLRGRMAWSGTVFSDDLGMHAAAVAGNLAQRMQAALDAGCDAVLVCDPGDSARLLDELSEEPANATAALLRLRGRNRYTAEELEQVGEWRHWRQSMTALEQSKWA